LTSARIDKLYADLRRSGGQGGGPLSPRTVRRVHNILHSALEQAVRWEWLGANPATRSSPPKLGPLDIHPPSPDEVGRLLAAAEAEDPDFASGRRSWEQRIDPYPQGVAPRDLGDGFRKRGCRQYWRAVQEHGHHQHIR
jgi:hypothetical protein